MTDEEKQAALEAEQAKAEAEAKDAEFETTIATLKPIFLLIKRLKCHYASKMSI